MTAGERLARCWPLTALNGAKPPAPHPAHCTARHARVQHAHAGREVEPATQPAAAESWCCSPCEGQAAHLEGQRGRADVPRPPKHVQAVSPAPDGPWSDGDAPAAPSRQRAALQARAHMRARCCTEDGPAPGNAAAARCPASSHDELRVVGVEGLAVLPRASSTTTPSSVTRHTWQDTCGREQVARALTPAPGQRTEHRAPSRPHALLLACRVIWAGMPVVSRYAVAMPYTARHARAPWWRVRSIPLEGGARDAEISGAGRTHAQWMGRRT